MTSHLTGSIFSLCESNRKFAGADGIPYRGSCTSDHPFSSSNSHAQVRSMSFLYDHIDPAKSAALDRKAAAVKAAEKAAKKKATQKATEKKAAAKKAEKKELEERQEALRAEKQEEAREAIDELLARQMEAGTGSLIDTRA